MTQTRERRSPVARIALQAAAAAFLWLLFSQPGFAAAAASHHVRHGSLTKPADRTIPLAVREEIQEATLRYLFRRYGASQGFSIYCIGEMPWHDFPASFQARFRGEVPPVLPLSRMRPSGDYHDRLTGKRVIALLVGEVRVVSPSSARVTEKASWDRQAGYGGTCTLIQEGKKWVVTREQVQMQF
ncbi:MAG: hypothetical protein LC772_03670 [Chloroflexi bacterium]|nr:hypothetical protein [Chloroflexota bacterium]